MNIMESIIYKETLSNFEVFQYYKYYKYIMQYINKNQQTKKI